MIVRQEIFDTYWRFAAARQEVFFARLRNAPPPWTTDPILSAYKFCNAYRASDRVSQFLIRHVIYGDDQAEGEVLFRILLFKMFNKIETWKHLQARLGAIRLAEFDQDRYSRVLQQAIDGGQAIYTSAYMSCASKAFGYDHKHDNHLALVRQMTQRDHIVSRITRAKGLAEIFDLLATYPLIGRFMAYQLAIDINYSELVDFDENSFTVAGPGAERGIQKCFVDNGNKSDAYLIRWMTERQDEEFRRLGLTFQSLWGRPLHDIDCQNLFCETDKYTRVSNPELKSARVRIKRHFQPTPGPIEYAYPPKWGINERVSATLAEVARQTRLADAIEPPRADVAGTSALITGDVVEETPAVPHRAAGAAYRQAVLDF